MRFVMFVLCILSSVLSAETKGYWTNIKVKSYHSLSLGVSTSGKSRYKTSLYKEGCAADRIFYPKGTRIYIIFSEGHKGRWFTVDDTHPDVIGGSGLIYVRFRTEQKAKNWKIGHYRVYVETP
jgi:3D (Asp-Asp-Asp) domain-containing protein